MISARLPSSLRASLLAAASSAAAALASSSRRISAGSSRRQTAPSGRSSSRIPRSTSVESRSWSHNPSKSAAAAPPAARAPARTESRNAASASTMGAPASVSFVSASSSVGSPNSGSTATPKMRSMRQCVGTLGTCPVHVAVGVRDDGKEFLHRAGCIEVVEQCLVNTCLVLSERGS
eukprot:scaffold137143_cov27-Tisochrysis_lutea.AAC.1